MKGTPSCCRDVIEPARRPLSLSGAALAARAPRLAALRVRRGAGPGAAHPSRAAAGQRRRPAGAAGHRAGVRPARDRPAPIPGAVTGPGLLGNAPVNLNRARHTFSVAAGLPAERVGARQRQGGLQGAVCPRQLPLRGQSRDRAPQRLGQGREAARPAQGGGGDAGGHAGRAHLQALLPAARRQQREAARRASGPTATCSAPTAPARRRPTSSSPTSRRRRRRRSPRAAGSPGTRPPAAGTGSASTARTPAGGTRGPRR